MTHENTIRCLLIIFSIVQVALSIRYMRMARAASTIFRHREEGVLLSLMIFVFYLAFVLGVLVYFVNPAWMDWSATNFPVWIRWLGLIPLLIGACWHVWALHHLGANLTISISTKPDHALITTGPYRHIRHPLYTAGMVESAGLALMIGNWCVALSAFLFWALVAFRTPMEERKLVTAFGDAYRDYIRRTGRFLPRAERFAVSR